MIYTGVGIIAIVVAGAVYLYVEGYLEPLQSYTDKLNLVGTPTPELAQTDLDIWKSPETLLRYLIEENAELIVVDAESPEDDVITGVIVTKSSNHSGMLQVRNVGGQSVLIGFSKYWYQDLQTILEVRNPDGSTKTFLSTEPFAPFPVVEDDGVATRPPAAVMPYLEAFLGNSVIDE